MVSKIVAGQNKSDLSMGRSGVLPGNTKFMKASFTNIGTSGPSGMKALQASYFICISVTKPEETQSE